MAGDPLSPREIRRYQKQIMLPGIGIEGQAKIRNSSVLVIGAGGLGCPVLLYLAAAGIGKLGIAEFDTIDESNLHRQILYESADIGKLKSIIAKTRLEKINPLVSIELVNLKIDAGNAGKFFKKYDIIVDATDNIATRYTISDSCVALKKPMVHGAVYKHEGQVSVFNFEGGPDYRDYNPEPEREGLKDPLPSNTGLMGVLPGITGTMMANEVIKIITGTGSVLDGKVLIFNILNNSFNTIKLNREKDYETTVNK